MPYNGLQESELGLMKAIVILYLPDFNFRKGFRLGLEFGLC